MQRVGVWAGVLLVLVLIYAFWEPGLTVTDGRHDRGMNGVWLQHGWLADDEWFRRQGRDDEAAGFRDPPEIEALCERLAARGMRDLFPHACPAQSTGALPGLSSDQIKHLTAAAARRGQRVMPWIGGVLQEHCRPEDPSWRSAFVASVAALLSDHPGLAGVQLNIEPWPDGHADLLLLLKELRDALPPDRVLSIAAYPPPTIWHRDVRVHWSESYFREIARRVDQMAVMMYDTSLTNSKLYRDLMADWTGQVLQWAGDTPVLLGLPAYEDAGAGYHDPAVENLRHALAGVHAGLARFDRLPANCQGVAIYSEWTCRGEDWEYLLRNFLAGGREAGNPADR